MVDDDEDDCLLIVDVLKESCVFNNFFCVEDGVEFLEFLCYEGCYIDIDKYFCFSFILFDLNMLRKDGREVF